MNARSRSTWLPTAAALCSLAVSLAVAQTIDTTPSRQTLEEAAQEGCDNVSGVLRRCAQQAKDADARQAAKRSNDALLRSRAATKESFDRVDRESRDEALKGGPPAAASNGDAQRLGNVTVTGKAQEQLTPEEVIQRNLAPPPPPSRTGTVVRYLADGARMECVEKCIGPACCVPLHNLPNPARDSNNIGR